MKKIIIIVAGALLLSAACAKIALQQNVPTVPQAALQPLPQ